MSCNYFVTPNTDNININGDVDTDTTIDFDNENYSNWYLIPEPVLLKILADLSARDILNVGECCRRWNQISKDDYLWRKIFQRDFKIDRNIGLKPGMYACIFCIPHVQYLFIIVLIMAVLI